MMPLIATDFPLPVDPAINKCGIFDRSAVWTIPEISRPKGTSNSLSGWLGCASTISLKDTVLIALLGTSIPISDLPGIGASIRTSLAASAKAMSSVKLTILLTFTPTAGWTSNFVTDGPKLALTTLASTPKLLKVCSKTPMFFSIFSYSPLWSVAWIVSNKSVGGSW